MSYQLLTLEHQDGIALLTLNRPEKRNALSRALTEELHAALGELEARDDVRVLLVTGAGGKAFASGADIAELKERTREDAFQGINSRLFTRLENFPAPTIAAIEGVCLGGGCELALACDLRVAARDAKLGQPEAGLGIVAGAGATYRLARLVGLGRARELLFTGRIVSGEEAARLGLVESVSEPGQALSTAQTLAKQITQKAPLAIRLTKALLTSYGRSQAAEGPLLAELSQAILFETQDKVEGMSAFLEKRPPSWGNK
jgi:enoyl-CoA hydratase